MKKVLTAIFVSIAALITGCVSHGHEFDETKVPQIQKGVTTEADLVKMFGEPTDRQTENGVTSVGWVCARRLGGIKAVSVELDSSGKVTKVMSESH